MTTSTPEKTPGLAPASEGKHPKTGAGWFKNFSIGRKLTIGFGMLVLITLIAIGFSFWGSIRVTDKIEKTSQERSPLALASANAQANLLRIVADVRGYLALGDPNFLYDYERDKQAFEVNLETLETLSTRSHAEHVNTQRLHEITAAFQEWTACPKDMTQVTTGEWYRCPEHPFELRDDQFDREPAYRLLMTDGALLAGEILIGINTLVETQSTRAATPENLDLLKDMAQFQGSFAAMFSALRGYVTTSNRIYRQEFESNRDLNTIQWERLWSKQAFLTEARQLDLQQIKRNRQKFLEGFKLTAYAVEALQQNDLPSTLLKDMIDTDQPGPLLEDEFLQYLEKKIGTALTFTHKDVLLKQTAFLTQIFGLLESERGREDLYVFKTDTLPRTQKMQSLLEELTKEQQELLQADLNQGQDALRQTNRRTLFSGLTAALLGVLLTLAFRANIAGPVIRLTATAEQIRGGDLEAQSRIDSKDEIGTLARTFNNMTTRLRETLQQVTKEKKRADDLLDVVIPIGVQLSSEKDFNRLLEKLLLEAKSFCHADAGTIYMVTDDGRLTFEILYTDTKQIARGGTTGQPIPFPPLSLQEQQEHAPVQRSIAAQAVISGETINLSDYNKPSEVIGDYAIHSLLTIPLKNNQGQVRGVLQLMNAQNPEHTHMIPFDHNLQQMMESFSSLAVAALEAYIREQSLKKEIMQLRIEIDEVKRQQQVREITETKTFTDLQAQAAAMRERRNRTRARKKKPTEEDPLQEENHG